MESRFDSESIYGLDYNRTVKRQKQEFNNKM